MPLIAFEAFVGVAILGGCVWELLSLRRDRRRREEDAKATSSDATEPPPPRS